MAEYLFYWRWDTVQREIRRHDNEPLNHVAGEQLLKVQPGDVLWIMTFNDGNVYLVSRIVVDHVTDRETAAKELGSHDLWEADWHVIAKQGTEAPLTCLNLGAFATELRFEGKTDRLPPNFTAQSFRSMRHLTAESARQLTDLWQEK